MDRKCKLDHQAGSKSTNGDNRTKEAALDKLRQMEWMRNKQDTWHMARSNSRGEDKKKSNKNEDNYFEGTVGQKKKRPHKPFKTEGSTMSIVSPGRISMAGSSVGPPPVNAWTQKKGSALFNKGPEEVDDDDEMLKLAVQESLKTAEADRKRQIERLRMTNLEITHPVKSQMCAEKEWVSEDEYYSEEEYSSSSLVDQSSKDNLHFIDTDLADEAPAYNKKRPIPKKKSVPQEKSSVNNNNNDISESSYSRIKSPSPAGNNANVFQSPSPHDNFSTPQVVQDSKFVPFEPSRSVGETGYDLVESYKKQNQKQKELMISDKGENISPSHLDVSSSLQSSLKFGDTHGLLEHIQNENLPPSDKSQSYDSSAYYPATKTNSPVKDNSTLSAFTNSTETDIMLHHFMRHEPPQVTNSQNSELPRDPYSLSGLQQYLPSLPAHFEQQTPQLNGLGAIHPKSSLTKSNEQDSSLSLSGSPLQSNTPYGSFEKQISLNMPENVHMPSQNLVHSMNLQSNHETINNLQATQYAVRNLASQMPYPNMPPGYVVPNHLLQGMAPLNPQVPGLPQYRLTNSNPIIPLPGQDLSNCSPQMYQAQLQHYHNLLMQQYQQAYTVPDTIESLKKEQGNTNSLSQMQSPPQMMSVQSQPPVVPNLKQPQMILPQDSIMPKQDGFQSEKHQLSSLNMGDQGIPQSKEEIMMQYHQALQTINQLKQQLTESQIQSPPIPIPRPFMYSPHPMAIGMNSYYPAMPVMQQQIVPNIGQVLPNTQQGYTNEPSEVELSQEPSVCAVGRGRGRLH